VSDKRWDRLSREGPQALARGGGGGARAVDRHVCDRVRRFLAKRHKEHGRGTRPFSRSEIFGTFGAQQLTTRPKASAVSLAMKSAGKPDAGNPHVRFDERGRETG
jgi:hypothetical protein